MPLRAPVAIALLLLSVIWGYSWVFLKLGSYDSGPFSFAGLRCFLGAVCLLVALKLSGRKFLPTRLRELVLLGVVNTTCLVGSSQWAVTLGAANRTSIVVFTMPFWTLILARFVLGERIRGAQWIAVALAALGLTAVMEPWAFEGPTTSQIIALGSAWIWASSAVMIKYIQLREPMDLLHLTAWQMAFGSVLLLVLASVSGEAPIVWTDRFLLSLGFTAFVSTACGWCLWVYLLDYLPAGTAGMMILLIPVVAVLSTSYHLGETLATSDITGVALIVSGLCLLTYKAISEHRSATSDVAPE